VTGTVDPQTAQLETLRSLLKQLGVNPDQLLAGTTPARTAVPTFNEYVPQVAQAVSLGTRRVYSSYSERITVRWGHRPIIEPTPLEIKRLAEEIRGEVIVRRNARGGRSAAEHLIAAMRCIYRRAVMDEPIREADNPATKVAKPGGWPAPDAPFPTPTWPRSSRSPERPATTPTSMPCSPACTWRPPAAAAAPSPYAHATWTRPVPRLSARERWHHPVAAGLPHWPCQPELAPV